MKLLLLLPAFILPFVSTAQDTLGRMPADRKLNSTDTVVTALEEVIVSASRTRERLMQSPVSIEKSGIADFSRTPALSFYDGLQNMKGVQMITPSLGFRVINMRGFSNTTNVRFAQLVDGMDIQSPHIGAPVGNALGPTDLDIRSIEIIPGSAAALYGMNAINGMASLFTRSAFTDQGFSFQQKTGVNHVGDASTDPKIYSETSARYAYAFSDQFAFKGNVAYSRGYDWTVDDRRDLNPNANSSTGLTGALNPASDPVNGYGNESSNRRTLSLGGKSYVVARTGYYENEVADYELRNIKADAGIYFKPTPGSLIAYTYHVASFNTVYQRSNRFRLENYVIRQHGLDYSSPSIKAKLYINHENTGQSYNLRSMAENMDRTSKTDDAWFTAYSNQFNSLLAGGEVPAAAHQGARLFADAGRPVPGSDQFSQNFDRLKDINNWDSGAALRVRANMIHAEAQVDLTAVYLAGFKKRTGIDLQAGLDYRVYVIVPDGNYFINPESGKTGKNLDYGRKGGFAAVNRSFGSEFKLGLVFRLDKNDYFNALTNVRASAVWSPSTRQNFRISYQDGYRYPSIFEAFSNVSSGGVKRVGGLRVMSSGIFEYSWLKSSIDAFKAAVTKDINTNGLTRDAAIRNNKGLLVQNQYTYLQPEHIHSFEAGYKGLFFNQRLFIDVDGYYNKYTSFIAQVEVSVPKTRNADSVAFALNDNRLQDRYRMWTNSASTVYNYGLSARIRYQLGKGYMVDGNVSYAKLHRRSSDDGLEDGFNTPRWMTNVSFSNDQALPRFGFSVTWAWADNYYWQSFLVNGRVPSNSTLDAQVSYKFSKTPLRVKLGASNMLNHYYYSFLGGPQIGGLYYSTLSYNL